MCYFSQFGGFSGSFGLGCLYWSLKSFGCSSDAIWSRAPQLGLCLSAPHGLSSSSGLAQACSHGSSVPREVERLSQSLLTLAFKTQASVSFCCTDPNNRATRIVQTQTQARQDSRDAEIDFTFCWVQLQRMLGHCFQSATSVGSDSRLLYTCYL